MVSISYLPYRQVTRLSDYECCSTNPLAWLTTSAVAPVHTLAYHVIAALHIAFHEPSQPPLVSIRPSITMKRSHGFPQGPIWDRPAKRTAIYTMHVHVTVDDSTDIVPVAADPWTNISEIIVHTGWYT